MAREQIRVRVDSKQWESLKQGNESNTDLLDRLLSDWQEQQQVIAALKAIDPSPSQAIGRLLLSHELLTRASITIASAAPVATETVPALIGGLENNSDDW